MPLGIGRSGDIIVAIGATTLVILLAFTLVPVAGPVAVGAMAASLAIGPTDRLAHHLGDRRRIAALLVSIAVAVAVLTPLALAVYLAIGQLADLVASFSHRAPEVSTKIHHALHLKASVRIEAFVQQAAERLLPAAQAVAAGSIELLVALLLLVATLYALLAEGRDWLHALARIPPLDGPVAHQFFDEFRQVSRAVLLGTYLTALLHGVAGGCAFLLFGLPHALLWGVVMTVASLIPAIGTALVWGPAAIVLVGGGHWIRGIGLLLYGLFVMGAIDYLIRPLLSHGHMRLPEYGVFVAMIGGVAAFGFAGIFVGPMIASLALVALAALARAGRSPRPGSA